MKVFIVDDSRIVCDGLKKMIEGMEEVEIAGTAENAQDATRFITELKPNVVILDIRLPGHSGLEVLKDIREKKLPIKVIILTNYPYPQYRKKCKELGAEYFFDKVTEIEKVRDTLKAMTKIT
ncbi:MAG: response regulator transcription factor [Pseudomonadota bacterium]